MHGYLGICIRHYPQQSGRFTFVYVKKYLEGLFKYLENVALWWKDMLTLKTIVTFNYVIYTTASFFLLFLPFSLVLSVKIKFTTTGLEALLWSMCLQSSLITNFSAID